MEFSLKDFTSQNGVIATIADNMMDVHLLDSVSGSFEEKVYRIFVNAYEICREIINNSPVQKWRIPDIYKSASSGYNGKDADKIMGALTLAVALILAEHLDQKLKFENQDFLKKMEDYMKNIYLKDEIIKIGGAEIVNPMGGISACQSAYRVLRRDTEKFAWLPNEQFNPVFLKKYEDFEYKKNLDSLFFPESVKHFVEYTNMLNDYQKENKELKSENAKLKKNTAPPSASTDCEDLERLKQEAEHYKSLYEVAEKQVKRYEEEFMPLDELEKMDWREKFCIKERIIFFQALTGCNLNEKDKNYGNQTQKALLIARFSGNDHNTIRVNINEISSEIEAVENGKLNEFSEGIRDAALNVYNFLHKAVKGDTVGSKPFQCMQAMENINKIYHLNLEDKRHLPPPKDNKFLIEPKPKES